MVWRNINTQCTGGTAHGVPFLASTLVATLTPPAPRQHYLRNEGCSVTKMSTVRWSFTSPTKQTPPAEAGPYLGCVDLLRWLLTGRLIPFLLSDSDSRSSDLWFWLRMSWPVGQWPIKHPKNNQVSANQKCRSQLEYLDRVLASPPLGWNVFVIGLVRNQLGSLWPKQSQMDFFGTRTCAKYFPTKARYKFDNGNYIKYFKLHRSVKSFKKIIASTWHPAFRTCKPCNRMVTQR